MLRPHAKRVLRPLSNPDAVNLSAVFKDLSALPPWWQKRLAAKIVAARRAEEALRTVHQTETRRRLQVCVRGLQAASVEA